MAAVATKGASHTRKKHAKQARRLTDVASPAAKGARASPFLHGGGSRYVVVVAKSIAAAVFLFGAICALTYTAAVPRNSARNVAEKQKPIANQKTASTRLGAALVSKVDADIRDAPRQNAKVLKRAPYGAYVEVIGQDGKWAHVHATGQNVTGWVDKAGLNF